MEGRDSNYEGELHGSSPGSGGDRAESTGSGSEIRDSFDNLLGSSRCDPREFSSGDRRAPRVGDAFHAHLDVCRRCRDNPFDLCFEGARLLHQVGGDLHKESAARTLGISTDEVTDEQRRAAKSINFMFMYSNIR